MLMHELMMSESEAIEALLETDQLSETEMFLLESMYEVDEMPEVLWTQAHAANQKVLLMQVLPPTPSLH